MNVGKPLSGVELEIVNSDDSLVPVCKEGRIRYRTPGLIPGYWNQESHTAANFKDGYFYPGDLGYLDEDGNLNLIGRESEHVNLGGEKVNLQDYDRASLRVEGLEEAAAFVLQDETGLNVIGLAFIGEVGNGKQLLERMRAKFGPQSPQVFFQVAEMPRNANGKTDRKKLAEAFRESQGNKKARPAL